MSKTKFFRVAVEGQTATDGRTITREMISECVETFNPETYGVRINMEHLRGFSGEPPFNAYGDVIALKAQEDTLKIGGKDERRLALYAQLDPTDALVALNKKRQKIYTSIEPQPDFGGTGKFGLVGLAVTDSPASLGTQRLEFSVKKDDPVAAEIKADLDRRKTSAASLFSSAFETTFEMEEERAPEPGALDKLAELFSGLLKKDEPKKPEAQIQAKPDPAAGAQDFAAVMQAFTVALAADRKAEKTASDQRFAALEKTVTEIKTALEAEAGQNYRARRPATGGDGRVKADC
ncbi:MAG: GPO family capsid scaffolding protein [Brevundimonas aurantiaca]|jgi:hypothetical protein|uniref:GPO family capsid scaffolding protein n=1 Tax=Brevundimonas aurantiaca TaxID=74316 RepID=UPI004034167C